MTLAVHPLIKDRPELAQDLQDLCDDDPKFAEQVEKFTQLAARLSAVQAGTETLDAEKTELLEQQCNAQQAILVHKLTHPAGGCCGGCGG
ncbi:MAG TPA: GTP-binding protein [Thiopseudomonas sp.]|nr:GTP-binding protein [Thiopseudomonas sp.]